MTAPCRCWGQPASLHAGHCCFADPDHDYAPGEPLPCGHDPRQGYTEPDLFEVCS